MTDASPMSPNHALHRTRSAVTPAADRARRRAEQEAIRLHEDYKVNTIEDLWALELKIREWRKDRWQAHFNVNYERANEQLAEWLAKGWLHESDLQRMSPERLHAITAKA